MSARHCFPSPLTRDKHFLSSSSSLTHTDTEPCEDHVHFADEDNEAPRASEICLKSQSGSEISHEHHCDVKAWTLSPPSTDTHTHVSALNITMPPRMAWAVRQGCSPWAVVSHCWTVDSREVPFPPFFPPLCNQEMCSCLFSWQSERATPLCLSSEVAITLPLLGLWQKQAKRDSTPQQPGLCLSCSKCFQVRGEDTAVQSWPSGITAEDGGPKSLREQWHQSETSADQRAFCFSCL